MSLSRRAVLSLPALLVAPAVMTGCNTAAIRDVYSARDSSGRLRTQAFRQKNTEIHMIVEFVTGRDDAILTVDFFPPKDSGVKIDELEFAPGKGDHKIDLQLKFVTSEGGQDKESTVGPWPVGKYSADFFIDGSYESTLDFVVA